MDNAFFMCFLDTLELLVKFQIKNENNDIITYHLYCYLKNRFQIKLPSALLE